MNMRLIMGATIVAGCALGHGAGARGGIVTAPYVNEFTTSAADFVPTTSGQWSLDTVNGVYRNTITAANTASSAMLQVSNLGGATQQDFRLSTTFTVSSFAHNTTTVGFAALGADANSTDSTGSYYLADVQFGAGNLRLFRINANQSLKEEVAPFTLTTGTPYTMTLDGEYAPGGDLKLTLTLSDGGSNSHSINATIAAANVITGNYFGFRNRTGGSQPLDVAFDRFEVQAVPEPAGIVLGLLGFLSLAVLFRRARCR